MYRPKFLQSKPILHVAPQQKKKKKQGKDVLPLEQQVYLIYPWHELIRSLYQIIKSEPKRTQVTGAIINPQKKGPGRS